MNKDKCMKCESVHDLHFQTDLIDYLCTTCIRKLAMRFDVDHHFETNPKTSYYLKDLNYFELMQAYPYLKLPVEKTIPTHYIYHTEVDGEIFDVRLVGEGTLNIHPSNMSIDTYRMKKLHIRLGDLMDTCDAFRFYLDNQDLHEAKEVFDLTIKPKIETASETMINLNTEAIVDPGEYIYYQETVPVSEEVFDAILRFSKQLEASRSKRKSITVSLPRQR